MICRWVGEVCRWTSLLAVDILCEPVGKSLTLFLWTLTLIIVKHEIRAALQETAESPPQQLTISVLSSKPQVPVADRAAQSKDETDPPSIKASGHPHQLPGPQVRAAVGVVAERCSKAAALWVFKGSPCHAEGNRGGKQDPSFIILPFQHFAVFKGSYYYELHLQCSSRFSTW